MAEKERDGGVSEYFRGLQEQVDRAYSVAQQAKAFGHDPELIVEPRLASRASERVEAITELKGIGADMEALTAQGLDRVQVAFRLIDSILGGRYGGLPREAAIMKCLQASTAVLTEAVVAGSTEGFDEVKILKNADGSEFLRVSLAGPSRSCLVPGTLIVANPAPVPIDQVSEKHAVVGRDGRFVRVVRTFKRRYSGKIVEIKPRCVPAVSLTTDHPVLVIKKVRCAWPSKKNNTRKYQSHQPEWVPAGSIRPHDVVVIPKFRETSEAPIRLAEYSLIHETLPLSPELFELAGWYVAEGNIDPTKKTVCFRVGAREQSFAERIKQLISKVFHEPVGVRKRRARLYIDLHNAVLARFFADNFGSRAQEKKVPPWIVLGAAKNLRSFVRGYFFGGGRGKHPLQVSAATTSKTLAHQMYLVLNKLGFLPVSWVQKGRGKRHNKYYMAISGKEQLQRIGSLLNYNYKPSGRRANQRFWQDALFFYVPVEKAVIKQYSGWVYNLQTEDNTYAVPFVVHNCGGTPLGMVMVFGDYIRRKMGLAEYKPTEQEVARLVEEVRLYRARQYRATPREVEVYARNCPVLITSGRGRSFVQVEVNRNLPRIDDLANNYLREPTMIHLHEGILLKARKLLANIKKYHIDGFAWVKELGRKGGETETADTYLEQMPAGRPVYSYANRRGGFALRYGRGRTCGLNAAAVHPSATYALMRYPALGTQAKISFPGKATVITPCDSIEPPVVKLNGGGVVRLSDPDEAERLDRAGEIKEILFAGEVLVSLGDVAESGKSLLPGSWCFEWWRQEVKDALARGKKTEIGADRVEELLSPAHPRPTYRESFKLARETDTALSPHFTFDWQSVTIEQADALRHAIAHAECPRLPADVKPVLESLLVCHRVGEGGVLELDPDDWLVLHRLLNRREPPEHAEDIYNWLFNTSDGIRVEKRYPTIIGARMGRTPNQPSNLREMKQRNHSLFPLSKAVGTHRLMNRAAELGEVEVEVMRYRCPKCGGVSVLLRCPSCGERCEPVVSPDALPEQKKTKVDMRGLFGDACRLAGVDPDETKVKGVWGLFGQEKVAEHPVKGVLRAKHDLCVFRDGTVRVDLTHAPCAAVKPSEIGTPVEKMRELGYKEDIKGGPLERADQLVWLKPHDIVLPSESGGAFVRISQFVDELLTRLYGMPPFYNAKEPRDLVGHLFGVLAPHTNAAVACRAIGYTDARLLYNHPLVISARRRDSDGDSDGASLLLDWLINSSAHYCKEERPGSLMDLPLYIIHRVVPAEVDTQVRNVDAVLGYPLELYRAAKAGRPASEVRPLVASIGDRIGGGEGTEFAGVPFTHDTKDIAEGPQVSRYIELLGDKHIGMVQKERIAAELMKKLRGVEEKDARARVVRGHLLKDVVGNLNAFAGQEFRCTNCGKRVRRVPVGGRCPECGRLLTQCVHFGGVVKYMEMLRNVVQEIGDPLLIEEEKVLKAQVSAYFAGAKPEEEATEPKLKQMKLVPEEGEELEWNEATRGERGE